jgi:predicted deacylase
MRRLLGSMVPGELSGTLILVPMANPLAARVHMQSFPYPDRALHRKINDMNRRWTPPFTGANQVDSLVAALAPVVAQADAAMDLHCHEYLYPCMALSNFGFPGCRELALATGMEVIRSSEGQEGMFGKYCREVLSVRALTIEMPPLRYVDHRNAEKGYQSVINVMRKLGMLPGLPDLPHRMAVYGGEESRSVNVKAEKEGFLARYCTPGDFVKKGDCVAEIFSPDRFEVVQRIAAPFESTLMSLGRPPQNWGDPEQDFMNVGDSVALFTTPSEVIVHT